MREYTIKNIGENGEATVLRFIEEPFEFRAGQFAMLSVPGNETKRAYSIASSPRGEFEFCIKMVGGKLTSLLNKLKKGDRIIVEGPYGEYSYKNEDNYFFVAGGTGIAPIISILRHIHKKKIKGNFVLIYSNKNIESTIYMKELEKLEKENKSIKIVFTFTKEAYENKRYEKGRVNKEMLKRHLGGIKNVFLCGPMVMVQNLKGLLEELGVKRVSFEGWG
ncbi:FAD-dependent oxidoreductase [Candidatus Micrarchaeota archaeon]|nr:FAD-dependent oxidoreductase [Candidatus Micrarchaeota archaeon]